MSSRPRNRFRKNAIFSSGVETPLVRVDESFGTMTALETGSWVPSQPAPAKISLADLQAACHSDRSHFLVHDVHEVHGYFGLISLSPFVSAARSEERVFLQRSQSLPNVPPQNAVSRS